MVFAPRYPGRGERRVQCLEWTHPIQLGYAHLTEGRMPAALHRGRPNPLARTMKLQRTPIALVQRKVKGGKGLLRKTSLLCILFTSIFVGYQPKRMNSNFFCIVTIFILPCYRKPNTVKKQTSTSQAIHNILVTVPTAKVPSPILEMT